MNVVTLFSQVSYESSVGASAIFITDIVDACVKDDVAIWADFVWRGNILNL